VGGAGAPGLRAPEAPQPIEASAGPRFEAAQGLADLGRAAPSDRDAAPLEQPARAAVPTPPRAASRASELSSLEAGAPAVPALAARTDGSAPSPTLRADPAPAQAPDEDTTRAPFDPVAELAPASAPRVGRAPAEDASAPRRLDEAPPVPSQRAAPAEQVDVALAPEAPRDDRPPLERTPYANRFGADKLRALEEFGGSPETERAVANGLRYLAAIQGARGAWGSPRDVHEKYRDVRVGKTGLALLAFLGAGHLQSGAGGTSEHALVAERALAWLVNEQDAESGQFGDSCPYGHGIATYALAECYALTHDERLRGPLERALARILAAQSQLADERARGGWPYYYADGEGWSGDLWPRASVSSWPVMALESARIGGIEIEDRPFDDARAFFLGAWDARLGAFRYSHDPARLASGYPTLPASTPAALFALSVLGVDLAHRDLEPAWRFVLARAPQGFEFTSEDDFVSRAQGNVYFWYYATLAAFRRGGAPWERWNRALQDTLLPAQASDGSWAPIDVYARQYAGDDAHDKSYTTAMCVLSLEVYYRYVTPLLKVGSTEPR
jgi:hypothetical protein